MAQSHYDMRNPMEVSARIQACEIMELDYTVTRYTADDGEQAYRMDIPELAMENMFKPSPVIKVPESRAQEEQISVKVKHEEEKKPPVQRMTLKEIEETTRVKKDS